MKKLIVTIFTGLAVLSCSGDNKNLAKESEKYLESKGYVNVSDIKETLPKPADVKVSYVGYAEKNSEVYRVYVDFNKEDKIVAVTDIQDQYFAFEKAALSKYKKENVEDVFVSAYAKGIDITLTTNKKDFSREDFNRISKDLVATLRTQYNLPKAKISSALELRDSRKTLMIENF